MTLTLASGLQRTLQLIHRTSIRHRFARLALAVLYVAPGARSQKSKTLAEALAHRSFDGRIISFDDVIAREAALLDPQGFVADLILPCAIDEIQRAPDLLLAIKQHVDRDTRPGRFLLTGSADLSALESVQDALPGRAIYQQLWPLAQSEIERSRGTFLESLFTDSRPPSTGFQPGRRGDVDRVVRGGYPGAYRLSQRTREAFFESYVSSIARDDVRAVTTARSGPAVETLLRLLAARTGALQNATAMSRDLGLDVKTVQILIEALRRLFLIICLPAWAPNSAKRVLSTPKLHLADSGLCAALTGIDQDRLLADQAGSLIGPLFATFAIGELTRLTSSHRHRLRISHFRDRNGHEVDAIIEAPDGSIVGIEVKSSATIRERDTHGLRYLRLQVGSRFRCGVVLCTSGQTLTARRRHLGRAARHALVLINAIRPKTQKGPQPRG